MAVYKDGQWFREPNFQEAVADGAAKVFGPIIGVVVVIFFVASNILNFLILLGAFIGGKILRMIVGGMPWFIRFPVWLATWVLFIGSIFYVVNSGKLVEDPVINAYTTVDNDGENAAIESINKITGLAKDIGTLEPGTQVRVLGVTRNQKYLVIETTDDNGKTTKGYLWKRSAEPVDATYTLSFWKRLDGFKLKKVPYFLKGGFYVSDQVPDYYFSCSNGNDGDTFSFFPVKRTDDNYTNSGLDEKIIKADPPVEIDGSFYNYKLEFSLGWTEEEYKKAFNKAYADRKQEPPAMPKYIPVPERFLGEYVITSSTSLVGPGGVKWALGNVKR
jgi:hypothetical protein